MFLSTPTPCELFDTRPEEWPVRQKLSLLETVCPQCKRLLGRWGILKESLFDRDITIYVVGALVTSHREISTGVSRWVNKDLPSDMSPPSNFNYPRGKFAWEGCEL